MLWAVFNPTGVKVNTEQIEYQSGVGGDEIDS